MPEAGSALLKLAPVDYLIAAIYFAVIIGVGLLVSKATKTAEGFFLAGRQMPAWISGLAYLSANLGALEIIGMAANGAQYGFNTLHFFWIGAIPAMVFLGIVMMPFYYSSRVHSVPEYLRRRYNSATHIVNAVIFACAQVLVSGINLYALALILQLLLGLPLALSVLLGAAFVLAYIILGGLAAAIYGEVLQLFVIIFGLLPIAVIGLHQIGGWDGLLAAMPAEKLVTWQGTEFGQGNWTNPVGDWIGIAMGSGFLLSFGYWTTNFAEVQRALSAKDLNAARRTPIIASFPKMFIPFLTVLPGMLAVAIIPNLGQAGGPAFNNAVPELMQRLLPSGVLGLALTALLAGFMAGAAANVSGFNTVFTYDIWKPYFAKGRTDHYYLTAGRIATVVAIALSVGTAFIAATYSNLNEYMQFLFGCFNTPLFTIFIIGLFWKRTSPWGATIGLLAGTAGAFAAHYILPSFAYFYQGGVVDPAKLSNPMVNYYTAIAAFVLAGGVTVLITLVTPPKPIAELAGLVWGVPDPNSPDAEELKRPTPLFRQPMVLGGISIALLIALSVAFYLMA
jgi:SSS family solute:Na+ symporter